MRFGVVGTYGTARELVELAQEAEAHGWDGFFTWDGISVGPLDTWDPWALLGAAAVSTSRIRLGAMVFAPARRRPWKLAREALTVDHLSGGRLVLPVGLGAVDDGGFSKVGGEATSPRERAELLDECLDVLEKAWSGEPVVHHGSHHTVDGLVFRPVPVQHPRIPVWPVGAWPSRRSLARAARWDGVVLQRRGGDGPLTGRDVAAAVAEITSLRQDTTGTAPRGAYDVVVEGVLPEDPSAARERVLELADAGATWWVESRWDPEPPGSLLARVRRGPPSL